MVNAYWQIGREIVEEEQRGLGRAEYGARLIEELAGQLSHEYGKGFNARNLWYMKDVYLAFPNLGKSNDADAQILNAVRSESTAAFIEASAARERLSWTHYRILAQISRPEARAFYFAECIKSRYLPTEEELRSELKRERSSLEIGQDIPE